MNDVNKDKERFSLKLLSPKLGDFIREGEGTEAYFPVDEFRRSSQIRSYALAAEGEVHTEGIYTFEARAPGDLKKMIKATVIKSAKPRERVGRKRIHERYKDSK